MHNQRIKRWPLLGFEDPRDGNGIGRIGTQAVDGFRGKSHKVPGPEQLCRSLKIGTR